LPVAKSSMLKFADIIPKVTNMKKNLALICLFASSNIYALSCPSNGTPLNLDTSIQEVIQACGQPASTNRYQKTININEQLVYYKNVLGKNIKVTLTFSYGKLQNINTLDTSPTTQTCQTKNQYGQDISAPCNPIEENSMTSGICGPLIQAGNSIDAVRGSCGTPASDTISSTKTINFQELKYHAQGPDTLVFEDGKLVDWKN